jgi:YbbR domain-containing protein
MKQLSYTAVIFLVILLGCQKDYSIDSIDSDIEIRLWETVDSTNRTLQLICTTERIYNCSNYTIKNTFSKSSNIINIDFKGIYIGDICLTAFGPANTVIDLGTLSNGTYNLNIKVEGKKSEGHLIVTDDYYAIELNKRRQIIIMNSPLFRIPANTIYGQVGYL